MMLTVCTDTNTTVTRARNPEYCFARRLFLIWRVSFVVRVL